eukprot:gnl/MRDRNA2_/MRDRNA2_77202_c0_seq1.p1 gnl/MRDRNA2_/MRDRNA2_77202_c0~~gnl/MRDRNA2_/MRDRNA2_77202_c0_seq1.p1  ORF type:complete len:1757 (+),score=298.27 gnl/MRDRNA2_/MRDRNA2_77202_c0_seq1:546-5273(+)
MRNEVLKLRKHESHMLEEIRNHQEDGLIREYERSWEQRSLRCSQELVSQFLGEVGARQEGSALIADLEAKIQTLQARKWEASDAGVQATHGRVVTDQWTSWVAMIHKRIWTSRVFQCFSRWRLEAITYAIGRLAGRNQFESHGVPSNKFKSPRSRTGRTAGACVRIARRHELVGKYDFFHGVAHNSLFVAMCFSAWLQYRLRVAQQVADERWLDAHKSVKRTQRHVSARVGLVQDKAQMQSNVTKASMELAEAHKAKAALQAKFDEMEARVTQCELERKELLETQESMLQHLDEAEKMNGQLHDELEFLQEQVRQGSQVQDQQRQSVDDVSLVPHPASALHNQQPADREPPGDDDNTYDEPVIVDREDDDNMYDEPVRAELPTSVGLLAKAGAESPTSPCSGGSSSPSSCFRKQGSSPKSKKHVATFTERASIYESAEPDPQDRDDAESFPNEDDEVTKTTSTACEHDDEARGATPDTPEMLSKKSSQETKTARRRAPRHCKSANDLGHAPNPMRHRGAVLAELERPFSPDRMDGASSPALSPRGRARTNALLRSQTAKLEQSKGLRQVDDEEEEEEKEKSEIQNKRFSVFPLAKYRKSRYVANMSDSLGHSVGTQTTTMSKGGLGSNWGFILHQLEREIENTVISTEKLPSASPFEIIEAWSVDKEFAWEVAKILRDRKEAAIFVQRMWRGKKGRKSLPAKLLNTGDSESKDAELREIEMTQRRALYAAALEKAGGKTASAGPSQKVATLLLWLQEHRHEYLGGGKIRQDPSYQTMGLDVLMDHSAAKATKLEVEAGRLAALTGGKLLETTFENRHDARSEARRKYGDNFSWLTGTMRASISYPTVSEAYEALCCLIEAEHQGMVFRSHQPRSDFYVLDVKDRIHHPDKNGNAFLLVLVSVDGLVAELTLELEPVVEVTRELQSKPCAFESLRLAQETLLVACMRCQGDLATKIARSYNLRGTAACDQNGRTAMHYCCIHGLTSVITVLCHNGGDVWVQDGFGGTLPVEFALRNSRIDLLKVLLRRMLRQEPASNTERRLRRFTKHSVLWWIDHMGGSQPPTDEVAPLLSYETLTTRELWLEVGEFLFRTLRQWDTTKSEEAHLIQALRSSAAAGQAPRVKALLMMGVQIWDEDQSTDQETAMDMAIIGRHRATASVIQEFLGPDRLSYACNRPLLRPGVNQHLYTAALDEDLPYAVAAIAAGANVNTSGTAGKTVLMIFAASGSLNACQFMIDYKAEVCAEDSYGCRASQYALALGHTAVHEFLVHLERSDPRERLPPLGSFYGEVVRNGCASAVLRYVSEMPEDARIEMINRAMDRGAAPTGLLIATEMACKNPEVQMVHDPQGQVVRALLYWRADPAIADSRGETPLHVAARQQHMALYDQLYVALAAIHGAAEAESIISSCRNQVGFTCMEILEGRESKAQTRKEMDKEESKKVLRMIFAFWGTFRRSLEALSWREEYDTQNAQLQSTRRKTIIDLIEAHNNKTPKSKRRTTVKVDADPHGSDPRHTLTVRQSEKTATGGHRPSVLAKATERVSRMSRVVVADHQDHHGLHAGHGHDKAVHAKPGSNLHH